MSTASLVLLLVSGFLTVCGLPCCLGCLQWFAVPLSLVTALIGLVGVLTDKDPITKQPRGLPIHLAALIGGIVLVVVGSIRCCVGGGIVCNDLPFGHDWQSNWHCASSAGIPADFDERNSFARMSFQRSNAGPETAWALHPAAHHAVAIHHEGR